MKNKSKLLSKTFIKKDNVYSVVNGNKIYDYTVCLEQIWENGKRKTWIITRSTNPKKIAHTIECRVKTQSDISYGFDGRNATKLYNSDKDFEKAILRIENIVKKK